MRVEETGFKNEWDTLTKTRTDDYARTYVDAFLAEHKSCTGCSLARIDFTQQTPGDIDDAFLIRVAFLLSGILKSMEMIARIGLSSFLVFLIGSPYSDFSNSRAVLFFKKFKEAVKCENLPNVEIAVGAVLQLRQNMTYDDLKRKAGEAIAKSKKEARGFVFVNADQALFEKPEQVVPVPEGAISNVQPDFEFLARLTDILFSSTEQTEQKDGIYDALAAIANYFDVDFVCVTEEARDKKTYKTTFQYSARGTPVITPNFQSIPSTLVLDYVKVFQSGKPVVCNRVSEFKQFGKLLAERQKLIGSKAVMQGGIWEEGVCVGLLTVSDSQRERAWSPGAIITFEQAVKAISPYIAKYRLERRLSQETYRDRVTGAWNVNGLLVEGTKRLFSEPDKRYAMISLDLINFKMINREYGHEVGDRVLRHVADILDLSLFDNECYARLYGDCFAALLCGKNRDELILRVKKIMLRIERVSEIRGPAIRLKCAVGVCEAEDTAANIAVLTEYSNIARVSVKPCDKSKFAFYGPQTKEQYETSQYLERQMRAGFGKKELAVYYQPRISLRTHRCMGVEMSVLWKLSDGRHLNPEQFMPIFEKNGFALEIDSFCIRRACKLLRRWMDMGREPVPVSFSVSKNHLSSLEFWRRAEYLREKYQIPKGYLEMEFGGNAFLHAQEMEKVVPVITRNGFLIALDSFGTDYSSPLFLVDAPIHTIKLDPKFVKFPDADEKRKILLSGLIRLAKQLNLRVIAPQITSKEQETFLVELGCDIFQGDLYSEAVPINVLESKLWESFLF